MHSPSNPLRFYFFFFPSFILQSHADITAECRAVFHRSLDLLACHADLPRLVRNMNFLDMEGNTVARAAADLPLALQVPPSPPPPSPTSLCASLLAKG